MSSFQEVRYDVVCLKSSGYVCFVGQQLSAPNVPRETVFSLISLHSLNNKASLQETLPADVSSCLYSNCFADDDDNF